MLFFNLLSILASAIVVAAQQPAIEKPALFAETLPVALNKLNELPAVKGEFFKEVPTPFTCENMAKLSGCDVATIESRRIQFKDDCWSPWYVCRCANATLSLDELQDRLARMPLGLRDHVAGLFGTEADSCSTSNAEGVVQVNGNCDAVRVMREASKLVDKGMSDTPAFHDAVANSTCTPDTCSAKSYAADWADVNLMIQYALEVEQLDEIAGHKSAECLRPQLDIIRKDERVLKTLKAKECVYENRFVLPQKFGEPF